MNIAVCDDEENIRIYIKEADRGTGCALPGYGIFVRGGIAAVLGAGGQGTVRYLFLDISMDGTDGMETAEQIRDWKEEREEVYGGVCPC